MGNVLAAVERLFAGVNIAGLMLREGVAVDVMVRKAETSGRTEAASCWTLCSAAWLGKEPPTLAQMAARRSYDVFSRLRNQQYEWICIESERERVQEPMLLSSRGQAPPLW